MIKKYFSFFLINSVANFFQFFSRWFFNFFLSLYLPAEIFGRFTYFYSIGTILANFFNFGNNLYLLHKCNSQEKNILIESVLISIILFFLVLPFSILLVDRNFIIIDLFSFLSALYLIFTFFYKSLGFFRREILLHFINGLLLIIFIGLLYIFSKLKIRLNISDIFIGLIIILLISISITLYKENLMNIHYIINYSFKDIVISLRERFFYAFHELLSILYRNLEFLLIPFFLNYSDLGVYRKLNLLVFPFFLLGSISGQITFLLIKEYSLYILKKIIWVNIVIGLLIIILGYNFYSFLLGNNFISVEGEYNSNIILLLLFIYFWIFFIKSPIEVSLTYLGFQKFRVKSLLINIIIFLIFDFILTYSFYLYGHIIAIIISNILLLCVFIFKLKSYTG